MKVLIVADVLGEENNGTTIACMNLARYLLSQGDEVTFLCADQYRKGQANYFVVPNLNLTKPLNYILAKNNVTLAKPKKKVINEALQNVDIVHIMIPFPLGVATCKRAKKLGIPVTAGFHCQAENFTAHVHLMNSHFANKRVYKYFYKHFYKYVDAIHYPTAFIRDLFEKEVKKKTNAYIISNGVNNIYRHKEMVRNDKDVFKILFIGRISKEKSHKVLVKAVSLSKYKDKIQLYFAGQGPREKEVLKYSEKVKIKKPIISFMPREDLVNLINSCDLYVHPAEIEIEAISCLEAISCGLVPVISNSPRSATKGFAIDENNLFECNNAKDLANKIDYWFEHPKEKKKRQEEYLDYTKQFEQNYCMQQMRDLLVKYSQDKNQFKGKEVPLHKRFYKSQITDDFAGTNIKTITLPNSYKYINNNIFFKVTAFFLYHLIARPIVFIINKCVYHNKIKNKKVLKKCKKQGYFIYANHTSTMGDAFTPNLLSKKKNYIIVSPDTVSIKGLQNIVKMLGAIPIPNNEITKKNYLSTIGTRINEGKSITIYPEAHIWPFNTEIRDFKSGSFRYPYDLNTPVYCLTNTWHKRRLGKKPRLVTYVDGPFYPNTSLPREEGIIELRNQVYSTMIKRSKEKKQYLYYKYINLEK